MRRIVVQRLRGFVKQDREKAARAGIPPPRIYDISQNDAGAAECQCENCQAIAKREGSESGPMIDFINAIADSIKDEYPDILLQTFAYNRTEPPPKTLKPRDNVIVRWCDVYSVVDLVRPLSHPYNSKNYGEILAWGKLAPHLAIWDYWISYGYYQFPTPYCMIQCIGPDMKLFVDMHAETMFCESEEDHEYGENFTALKYWLGYKMMVNPYQPVEPLIQTFMAGYFGAAAPRMDEYLKYLQERIDKEAEFLHGAQRPAPAQVPGLGVLPDGGDDLRCRRGAGQAEQSGGPARPEGTSGCGRRPALPLAVARPQAGGGRDHAVRPRDRDPPLRDELARAVQGVLLREGASRARSEDCPIGRAVPGPETARAVPETAAPRCGRFQLAHVLALLPRTLKSFVADAEAAGGMAAAFVGDSDDAHKKPLSFGVTGGPTVTLKPEEVPQDGKYHVFKIGRTQCEEGDDGLGPCEQAYGRERRPAGRGGGQRPDRQ